MTDTFTLDTSGYVNLDPRAVFPDWDVDEHGCVLRWDDIGALPYGQLAQGCIKAAIKSLDAPPTRNVQRRGVYNLSGGTYRALGFSDLAPATLARILQDCASFENIAVGLGLTKLGEREGRHFYAGRNNGTLQGAFAAAFPPLTLRLGDDGLIYFGEGA